MSDIQEVVDRLTSIVEQSKQDRSRLGYFAALYRKVTLQVKERIEAGGYFEDDERMERLDVVFARRYLTAYDDWQAGRTPTQSWEVAFQAAPDWWPIVLQHLLLGMNAHINLDLGIAAFDTVGREGLPSLHTDFNRINELLAGLVGDVQKELAWVWPPLRWLNRGLGGVEKTIINFSMEKARDSAWAFAEELASVPEADRSATIDARDAEVRELAQRIRHPGWLLGLVTRAVRLSERGTIPEIIEVLE